MEGGCAGRVGEKQGRSQYFDKGDTGQANKSRVNSVSYYLDGVRRSIYLVGREVRLHSWG